MKLLPALVLLAPLAAASHAQIAPMPGTVPGLTPIDQAHQAFVVAQTMSMSLTNQAQLQSMIAAQAGMLSAQASGIFLAEAAALQVHQNSMLGSQAFGQLAAINAMQRTLVLRKQLQVQSAILHMRTLGIENASAIQGAVRLASLDPAKSLHQTAMIRTEAAQAAGQTASAQTATPPPTPDAAALSAEPPPMMIRPTFGYSLTVEKPKFSVEPGIISAGTKIRLKSETHYATLYYTTNGWTPTTQSAKYTGPITINGTTHLQVIAVGPNFLRSTVERADYEVPNSPAPVLETTVSVPADGTLRAGTPVRVVFAGKDIASDTAAVGDEITLVLDEDIKLGDKVLAPKGSPVNAALTIADSGHGSAPGDLVFEIHSVEVAGKRVPLFGGETLEGVKGGKDATIKPGMTAMAFVSADTAVK